MKLRRQVEQLAHAYKRKGGKDNRRQQAARMMAFAAHAEGLGALEIGQVGGKHVVSYWRALRSTSGLADATLYSHWLAIRELWRLAGTSGEPPRPHLQSSLKIAQNLFTSEEFKPMQIKTEGRKD